MNAFVTIPFFRIMIPFVSGIVIGICYPNVSLHWFWLVLLIISISVLTFYKTSNSVSKKILLCLADLFLLMYGLTLVNVTQLSKQDLFYGRLVQPVEKPGLLNFVAVIDDLPVEKPKTIKCN